MPGLCRGMGDPLCPYKKALAEKKDNLEEATGLGIKGNRTRQPSRHTTSFQR